MLVMQTEKFWRNIVGILVQLHRYVSGHRISLLASKDQCGFDWNATFYSCLLLQCTAKQCTVKSFPFMIPGKHFSFGKGTLHLVTPDTFI